MMRTVTLENFFIKTGTEILLILCFVHPRNHSSPLSDFTHTYVSDHLWNSIKPLHKEEENIYRKEKTIEVYREEDTSPQLEGFVFPSLDTGESEIR